MSKPGFTTHNPKFLTWVHGIVENGFVRSMPNGEQPNQRQEALD